MEKHTARKKLRCEKISDGEIQKREDASARQGRKGAKHCVFPMFCGSGGSKSRLAKAADAETSAQMRHAKLHAGVAREAHFEVKSVKNCRSRSTLEVEMSKECTPLWREARLQVKSVKTRPVRTTFASRDVEKLHAVVA